MNVYPQGGKICYKVGYCFNLEECSRGEGGGRKEKKVGRILSYKICQHFNKLVQIGEKATAERSEQGPSAKKIIFTFIALISPILFQSSHNITQGSVGWALQGPRDPPEEA